MDSTDLLCPHKGVLRFYLSQLAVSFRKRRFLLNVYIHFTGLVWDLKNVLVANKSNLPFAYIEEKDVLPIQQVYSSNEPLLRFQVKKYRYSYAMPPSNIGKLKMKEKRRPATCQHVNGCY